jgi:threonine synthase
MVRPERLKDFALQFLPQIMKIAIEKEKTNDLCILVATSGDTGGAALEGFADVLGTSCIVFFPRGGVSPLQQAQMQSATGGNILTLEVSGDFDQAQSAMKHLFQDADFTARVQELGVSLSSANSINIGRLLPQIFYSFAAHAQMVESGAISFDEKIDICVPTGNFGDIFSAFLAKKMGLPVQKLICASNANNTSAQVIKTGIFDVRERKTAHTASPAMDILRASNLERALFCASGNDSQKISRWQKELLEDGFFELDPQTLHTLRDDFAGETVSDNETLFEIQTTLEENKYLLDPHTAVARRAARQYQSRSSSSAKMLLFSTAHYGKFGQTVFSAVCPDQKMPSHESEILRLLQQKSIEPHLPQQFLRVLEKEKVHTQFIQNDVSLFKQAILSFLRSQRS